MMKSLSKIIALCFPALLAGSLVLDGCGGGTSGTDGGGSFRSTITGTLEDDTGNGISQASIVLENTADLATTDSDGSFAISALISSEPLALTVRTSSGQGGSVDIGTFTPEEPNAFIILILDQSGNIRVRSIQISPLATPTPAASPPAALTPPAQITAAPTPTPPTVSEATLYFEITVVNSRNVPLQGMRISVEGASAFTNSSGLATFSAPYRGGPIRIIYSLGDFQGFSLLGRVPVQDALIQIMLEAGLSQLLSPSPAGCSPIRGSGGAGKPKPGCSLKPKIRNITRIPRG